MWIESVNGFEIHCITEGLQIDKAGLSTKIQSQLDKTNSFYMAAPGVRERQTAPNEHAAEGDARRHTAGSGGGPGPGPSSHPPTAAGGPGQETGGGRPETTA